MQQLKNFQLSMTEIYVGDWGCHDIQHLIYFTSVYYIIFSQNKSYISHNNNNHNLIMIEEQEKNLTHLLDLTLGLALSKRKTINNQSISYLCF